MQRRERYTAESTKDYAIEYMDGFYVFKAREEPQTPTYGCSLLLVSPQEQVVLDKQKEAEKKKIDQFSQLVSTNLKQGTTGSGQ